MPRRNRQPDWPPLPPTTMPSFSVTEISGQLVRDLKPPRTLRQWVREELLRRDGGSGGTPDATA